jgi:hypothetical protein
MFLLLIFIVFVGANLPSTSIIWIEHGGPRRQTHVNSQPTAQLPHYILAHYIQSNYRLTHHTMAAAGGSHYTGDNSHSYYSWILVNPAYHSHEGKNICT